MSVLALAVPGPVPGPVYTVTPVDETPGPDVQVPGLHESRPGPVIGRWDTVFGEFMEKQGLLFDFGFRPSHETSKYCNVVYIKNK